MLEEKWFYVDGTVYQAEKLINTVNLNSIYLHIAKYQRISLHTLQKKSKGRRTTAETRCLNTPKGGDIFHCLKLNQTNNKNNK